MTHISTIDSISHDFNQSPENDVIKINHLIHQIFNINEPKKYSEENLLKAIKIELEKEENSLADILTINENVKINYFIEYVNSLENTENNFKNEYLENIQKSLFDISETFELNLEAIKLNKKNSPKYYSVFHNVTQFEDNFNLSSELSNFSFKPELLVNNENNIFNYEPNVFSPNNIKSIITYYLKSENDSQILVNNHQKSIAHQLIEAIIQQTAQSNLSNQFSEKFKSIYKFIEENNQQTNNRSFQNQLTSKIVSELELKDLSLDPYLSFLNNLNKKRPKP